MTASQQIFEEWKAMYRRMADAVRHDEEITAQRDDLLAAAKAAVIFLSENPVAVAGSYTDEQQEQLIVQLSDAAARAEGEAKL